MAFDPGSIQMNPSVPTCWKGCKQKAIYVHCWWQCDIIKKYWQKFRSDYPYSGFKIPFTAEGFLINHWKGRPVPNHNKQTIAILVAAAKQKIATNWNSKYAATIENWYNRIWQIFVMYKITDKMHHINLPRKVTGFLVSFLHKNSNSPIFLIRNFFSCNIVMIHNKADRYAYMNAWHSVTMK